MRELGRRSEPAEVPFRKKRRKLNAIHGRAGERPPLITVHRMGQRIEIAAACPGALALGLKAGIPLTQARILVPGLDVRASEPEADAAFLRRLALFAARRWTPRAAVADPASLFLDLSGVCHLHGGERRMCERILAFCARLGFVARIAVAGTYGAAHALVRRSDEAIALCPAGGEAEAIASFPLEALRLEEHVLNAAHRLGISSIGELIALPRGPLNRRFGDTLVRRLDQALGRAAEPFDPIVSEEVPCATLRLLEPIATAEAIEQVLSDLMARLVFLLEQQGLAVRALNLMCERVDGSAQQVGIGTARATRDGRHLLHLLKPKIEEIDPGFGIEAMHLVAVRCEPLGPQPIESELTGEQPFDLVPLVDRLIGRLEARRLFRWSAVESDVPERSCRRVGPLKAVVDWPRWPRPVRLLSPPEPVEKVVALLPDGPPRRFTWRGRSHLVRRADGPERIHGEWWKRSGEADAVRDYFQVEDEDGRRFWLYRRGDGVDPRTGDLSWWLQGAFG
jgi:protein ImuB